MQKKLLCLMLVSLFVLALVGCDYAPSSEASRPVSGISEAVSMKPSNNTDIASTTSEIEEEDTWWTYTETVHTHYGKYSVHMPYLGGPRAGGFLSAKKEYQSMMNGLMFAGYNYLDIDYGIDVSQIISPEELPEAYYNPLCELFMDVVTEKGPFSIWYTDDTEISFTIDSREMVQVNDYEACKFYGSIKCTNLRHDPYEANLKLVGYATFLELEHTPIFIMAVDGLLDQTKNDEVEGLADRMMESLQEEIYTDEKLYELYGEAG